jgi:phage terminase large subunit-like protein
MPPREVKPCPQQKITDCGGKYYYDRDAADYVVEFFETQVVYTVGDQAGKPIVLMDWQKDLVLRPLFGWKRVSDGYRRFRRAFVFIPKKNGKTTMCGGVGLYMTGMDSEFRAKVYCAATDKEQADMVHEEARTIIDLSQSLGEMYKVVPGRQLITVPEMKSSFIPVSKETKSRHGINAHCVIFDELQALKDPELYEVMTSGSGAARKQPLQITITTAGAEKTSICYEEYEHAKDVLADENVDEQTLAVIFEPGKHDDWTDPRVWHKVNPSLGVTLQEYDLVQEGEQAKKSPRKENLFKRLRLNMWTSQITRWLSSEVWQAAAGKYSEADLKGKICFGGLDLSSVLDLTALALAFPEPDMLYLWLYLFMPADRIEEAEKRDKVPYGRWVTQGHIIATPGNVVDYAAVVGKMAEAQQMFSLQEIGFDPYNATMAVQQAERMGIKMVPVSQNFSTISQPTKELERRLVAGILRHPNNAALNWMADNIEVRTGPNGVIAPNKPAEKSGKQKRIDGMTASIIAIDRVLRVPLEDNFEDYKVRTL